MKIPNFTEIESRILAMVPRVMTEADIRMNSNIHGLSEDLAMLLVDLYYELDSLAFKYKIEEKDLLSIAAVLQRGQSIPARAVQRAIGESNG